LFCPKRKWVIPAGIYSGATSPGGIFPLVRKMKDKGERGPLGSPPGGFFWSGASEPKKGWL